MEHLVQFGISIDDAKIEQMVAEKATAEVIKQITSATSMFTKGSYYAESDLRKMFKNEVSKLVDENREQILAEVIKQVSQNVMKTKAMIAAKSKLVDMMEESDGN